MPHRFTGSRLIIASHNAGKLAEISVLMTPFNIATVSVAEFGLPEPEETSPSFTENAVLKARFAAQATNTPALADDSGLAVVGLGGAPGIHSARWAETPKGRDFAVAMARVEAELGDGADRRAAFVCALALYWPDGHCESFEGRVDGVLTFPPRGGRGFGYDPIFMPDGHAVTFGEMEADEKHRISHRARAFAKIVAGCFDGS